VPVPVPDPDPVIVIHDAGFVVVHEQPAVAVTATLEATALALQEALVGLMLKAHAPAWVTVNVWPAIVIVPVLGVVEGLAATEYATVPLPVPLEPLVTVIHPAELVAVQVQPAAPVTATEPVLAPAPTELPVGEIDVEHDAVNANWLDTVLRPNWFAALTAETRAS
jgi:hypothetical protein